ncbi:MAG TPA: PVC-type heme-binding CxxCH protein, partial [Candidatus Saccharimonadales bacterium]|nr:PVC-type heme-binding CxxCH protein [Candidatus Saccharimonadales bacterium]
MRAIFKQMRRFVPWIVGGLHLVLLATKVFGEPALPSVERLKSSPVLRHLKSNPMPTAPRTGPEKTIAQMYVPQGFRVELITGEPDLQQPVAFAWDERGRIWVIEAYSYPTKRPPGQGQDKIVIFEDRDGDGKFETRKVFAEGLNLASGLEVGYGGVWVGAAPELLFIPDRNHDNVPDGPPEVLLEGFGYQDTHECMNSFLWGPDGWLYGNQGVFNYARIGKPGAPDKERTELRAGVWRYHPVRHEFEIFANGGSNPWGLDYDEHGQLFMTHCRSSWGRGCTTHVIQGGHYWNQANANYASFIIANPPREFPEFQNFMLASARYDHGAGGAGKPGSDAIYGGHSHVGTMIYQGDN